VLQEKLDGGNMCRYLLIPIMLIFFYSCISCCALDNNEINTSAYSKITCVPIIVADSENTRQLIKDNEITIITKDNNLEVSRNTILLRWQDGIFKVTFEILHYKGDVKWEDVAVVLYDAGHKKLEQISPISWEGYGTSTFPRSYKGNVSFKFNNTVIKTPITVEVKAKIIEYPWLSDKSNAIKKEMDISFLGKFALVSSMNNNVPNKSIYGK